MKYPIWVKAKQMDRTMGRVEVTPIGGYAYVSVDDIINSSSTAEIKKLNISIDEKIDRAKKNLNNLILVIVNGRMQALKDVAGEQYGISLFNGGGAGEVLDLPPINWDEVFEEQT